MLILPARSHAEPLGSSSSPRTPALGPSPHHRKASPGFSSTFNTEHLPGSPSRVGCARAPTRALLSPSLCRRSFALKSHPAL